MIRISGGSPAAPLLRDLLSISGRTLTEHKPLYDLTIEEGETLSIDSIDDAFEALVVRMLRQQLPDLQLVFSPPSEPARAGAARFTVPRDERIEYEFARAVLRAVETGLQTPPAAPVRFYSRPPFVAAITALLILLALFAVSVTGARAQTTGSSSVKIQDSTDPAKKVAVTADGKLNVTCDNCTGSGGASGGLTDAQLRATPVPVSGSVNVSNFPALQPVSDNGGSITIDGTVSVLTGDNGETSTFSAAEATATVPSDGISTLAFSYTGTFTGTIVIEGSRNGAGGTYTGIPVFNSQTELKANNPSSPGVVYYANVAGYAFVRARCSAYTSGSAAIIMRASSGSRLVAITDQLPPGTNAIGKLAVNDGIDIGDVTINNTSLTVAGAKTNNNAAPGATNLGVLPAVANAAAPSFTEGNLGALSMDLSGALRVSGSAGGGVAQTQVRNAADNAWENVGPATGNGKMPVAGAKSNNSAAPGATNVGTLPAVANASAPSYTEGNLVALSTDLTGALRVSGGGGAGGTQYDEDTPSAAADKLTMAGVVRKDAAATLVDTDGDRTQLQVDALGRLHTNGSGVTQPVSGTFFQATQPISAASLPLPSGASTSAKQPALGTAGSASSDVLTVQGIASMTALKTDGSAVTQPVSGTVTVTDGAGALNTIVDSGTITANAGTGTFTVGDGTGPLTVDGTVSLSQTTSANDVDVLTLPSLPSGTNNIGDVDVLTLPTINVNNVSGTISLPTGAATLTEQQAQTTSLQLADDAIHGDDAVRGKSQLSGAVLDDTATTAITENQAGYLRMSARRALLVEGVASMTALKTDGSATTQPVSIAASVAVTQATASNLNVTVTDGAGALNTIIDSGTVTANAGTGTFTVAGAKTNNNAAPGATNVGVLPAVANASAPSYTEGNQVSLSTDLTGALRISGGAGGGGTQYDEDTVSTAADKLTMAGAVRKDTAATLVDTDGDRTQLQVDAVGRLHTNGSGVTQPVSGTFWQVTQPVSIAAAVTVSQATAANLNATVTDGAGALNTIVDSSALPTGAATLAEQQTQTAAIQLIDDSIHADDAVRGKSQLAAAVLDDTATVAITENQAGYLRMSTRRALLVEGVASGTSINVVCTSGCAAPTTQLTYSTGVKFTPATTVSKDFWTITGSATKTISILKIIISGTSTAASIADLSLIKRSTANSGGTSTTPTIVPNDSNNAAATAVVRAYTAVSTEGALVGQVWAGRYYSAIGAATATSPPSALPLVIDYTEAGRQPIVLRGVAQSLALQAATALAAGTALSITVEFTEQ